MPGRDTWENNPRECVLFSFYIFTPDPILLFNFGYVTFDFL